MSEKTWSDWGPYPFNIGQKTCHYCKFSEWYWHPYSVDKCVLSCHILHKEVKTLPLDCDKFKPQEHWNIYYSKKEGKSE